jgi:hypothetical protein
MNPEERVQGFYRKQGGGYSEKYRRWRTSFLSYGFQES